MPWGRLRVRRTGRGRTLLAIHGLGGSGRYWDGLAQRVGDRYTVVAPDLGGFGASSKPAGRADREFHLATLDRLAADLGPAVVVGHSLGGVLSLLWTARRPEQVRALSLNASPYPTPRPEWNPEHWGGPRGTVARGMAGTARIAWPVLSLPAQIFSSYPGGVVRDFGRQSLSGRGWTLWSLWTDPDLAPVVAAAASRLPSSLPILLQHAADDRSVAFDSLEEWGRLLPDAERRLLPHGGHQFLLKHHFDAIVPWLRGLPPH